MYHYKTERLLMLSKTTALSEVPLSFGSNEHLTNFCNTFDHNLDIDIDIAEYRPAL